MNPASLCLTFGKLERTGVACARKTYNKPTSAARPLTRSAQKWVRQYSTSRATNARLMLSYTQSRVPHMPTGALTTKSSLISSRMVTNPHGALTRQSRRTTFIRTESTPNPDSMKFMPDRELMEPGQSIDFDSAVGAARSPLAKLLFRNESVKRVFIGTTFVTVTKDEDLEWEDVKPSIFADLMEFLSSGEPVLLGEAPISDTTILDTDSEEVALIKTLLETRIRPSIQDDGGDITYRGFIDGVVFIQLQGSCTSCPSSTVTLKSGVEKMLKHWCTDVLSVVSVESEEEWNRIAAGNSLGDRPTGIAGEIPVGAASDDAPSGHEIDMNAAEPPRAKMDEL